MTQPPVIGAALTLEGLRANRDWILDAPRDLELQAFTEAGVLDGDWPAIADEILTLLDGHTGRRGLHGPFWGFSIAAIDPDVRAVVQRRLDAALDVAATMSADQIVIHSPFNPWIEANLFTSDYLAERFFDACHATLAPAVARAADAGVTFVIENCEDTDPHARCRLADSLDSAAVAVSIDTGHAHFAHRMHGAPPVDAFVAAAGPRLQHVHLQDIDGAADRHWPLGEGEIPWPAVLAAAARNAPAARLLVETHGAGTTRASIEHLQARGIGR